MTSSQTAAESKFQESTFSNVESFTNGISGTGQQEYETSQSEMSQSAQSSYQESSSNTFESLANGFTGGVREFEESMSQTAQSFQESVQESSSNTMESLTNGFSGLEGYESSQTRSTSSSSKSSSSNFEYSSSSMTSSFDQNLYLNALERCKFISDIERQCYLKWLETFSDTSLDYYNNILDYLSIQKALSNEILDYSLIQKEILSVQEMFASNGIYDIDVDLSTKMAICEKSKSKIKKALKALSQNSALYELLKYSINDDITTLPCTIGLCSGILKNQQTFFEETKSHSSSSASSVASSIGSTKSTQATEVTQYESILKAANVQASENHVFLSHLKKVASDKMCLFTDIIGSLNQNTQVLTNDMITDFAALNQEIESLYKLLATEKFFVENANWHSKKDILADIKCKLSHALKYLSQDCFMYRALQYCLKEDVCSVPLFVGLNYYLLQQQSSFFISTTASSSSSRSTCV